MFGKLSTIRGGSSVLKPYRSEQTGWYGLERRRKIEKHVGSGDLSPMAGFSRGKRPEERRQWESARKQHKTTTEATRADGRDGGSGEMFEHEAVHGPCRVGSTRQQPEMTGADVNLKKPS